MIDMSDKLITYALSAAPAFPPPGRWTPMTYSGEARGAAAYNIASAIRLGAFMLTTEERARLAVELLTQHSTDHAHAAGYGEPA